MSELLVARDVLAGNDPQFLAMTSTIDTEPLTCGCGQDLGAALGSHCCPRCGIRLAPHKVLDLTASCGSGANLV